MSLTQNEADLNDKSTGINWIAYNPDGKYVAVASELNFANVFNASTGRVFMTLKGHTAEIQFGSFSPDGKLIATSSVDGTARVWNATTGENVLMLPITEYISFLDDGKELAIGNKSGLHVFDLPIDDLVARAKTQVTRTLTTDDYQQYLHIPACPAQ